MRSTAFLVLALLAAAALALIWPTGSSACPFCFDPDGPSSGPHFSWVLADSVTACPAGDSVYAGHPTHPHASRLRIEVWYSDANCFTKIGVPPDSIWITYSTVAGNLLVNDKGEKVFADDSTDQCGHTRITIPSFSGCGTLQVNLYISGVFKGSKNVLVRTADTDASGRVLIADEGSPCDLDWDGQITSADADSITKHRDHWRRNALHGTMVRRTNYCETCQPGEVGTRGGSEVFWSASQRYISHTAFVDAGPGNDPSCKVFIVPSDPAEGNNRTQLTFQPIQSHDYDPSWSPLNTEIAFDRADSVIIRKGVPWSGSTTEFVVTSSNNCGVERGDNYPAISPDGQWVAFSRCNGEPPIGPGGWSLWKIRITGGTATQLTAAAARTDNYPQWSPDGSFVFFQRQDATIGPQYSLWKVPSGGGMAQQVFIPPSTPDIFDAVTPGLSPDGQILLTGYGKRNLLVRNVVTNTLDPALPSPTAAKLVANYADTSFADKGADPLLSPRLSPDGSRLALGSKQVWAARRNMNLPPQFTSVTSTYEGTRSIPDTAATMSFDFYFGQNRITVSASDPEGNALTYKADFLEPWMTWTPSLRRLNGSPPPSAAGKTFYVKFWVTTPSGGTDAFIAVIGVALPLGLMAATPAADPDSPPLQVNPTQGEFAVASPALPGVMAHLSVFDITGRRVAFVSGPSGSALVWDGKDDRIGSLAAPGIYFYRMEAGNHRRDGKVAIVR